MHRISFYMRPRSVLTIRDRGDEVFVNAKNTPGYQSKACGCMLGFLFSSLVS